MAIDPNIILQGAQLAGRNTVDFADLARLKLQADAMRQQQAMQQQEMQRQTTGDQQALARQQQMQQLLGAGGTPQEMQQRLTQGGFLDEAGKVGKQGIEREGADIAKQKQTGEMLKQAASSVLANPTEQNALTVLSQLQQLTGQNMDAEKAQVMQLRGDPNAIRRWAAAHALEAEKLLPRVETTDLGGTSERRNIDPLTGQPIGPAEVRTKTMTPGEIASNRVSQGNLAVAQQRLALEQGKEKRESVSQQKLDMKVAQELEKSENRKAQTLSKLDTTLGKVDEALESTGFFTSGIIGKTGALIPGSSAYDLDKTIDTIKTNIGFDTLQEMRDNSPTGGALGQVSDREINFLQSALASLDIGQSKDQQLKHLKQIKTHYENWKKTLQGTAKVNSLPDPAQHRGYEATSDDGTTYVSDGTKWVRKK